jgi:hypothetical protein
MWRRELRFEHIHRQRIAAPRAIRPLPRRPEGQGVIAPASTIPPATGAATLSEMNAPDEVQDRRDGDGDLRLARAGRDRRRHRVRRVVKAVREVEAQRSGNDEADDDVPGIHERSATLVPRSRPAMAGYRAFTVPLPSAYCEHWRR